MEAEQGPPADATAQGGERTQTRRSSQSLHGRKVHEMIAVGNTIILEKLSYKAWQKQYGRSVALRAPGMFVEP